MNSNEGLTQLKQLYPQHQDLIYLDQKGKAPLFRLALILGCNPAPLALELTEKLDCHCDGGWLLFDKE